MNRDSRKPGKGAKSAKQKRIIRGKADQIAKLTAAPTPAAPDLEPPSTPLNREQLRSLALDELARHALDAAKSLGQSAKKLGKRERGAGQREAAQKWLLEKVFTLIADAPAGVAGEQAGGSLGGSPNDVVDLAERRRELQAAIRRQRRDMNK